MSIFADHDYVVGSGGIGSGGIGSGGGGRNRLLYHDLYISYYFIGYK
jgi:hypothetical protein